ncbi:MAG: nucleotidyltransferase family protein [Clostridiales bacterium]|jgi:GTP:adenosylcobinamide-phosphate guanylyltransferase|nr:nucleotidyltransferase family protein [Eubacteriales bacterium]MDH7567088.1 nucleotidyltransferase family protein [Clostridiales bacterium]
MDAIILAGMEPRRNSGISGNKALLPINGKMMVEYVIDAVRGVDEIEKIVVIGPEDKLKELVKYKIDAVIPPKGSIMDNLMSGVRYVGYTNYILVCASDIPMVSSEAIAHFIGSAKSLKADLCYPVIEKTLSEKKYPEMARTYVKIKDGTFTGGNLFYINPEVLERCAGLADRLASFRKNPLKLARELSFYFMVQLFLGTLTIERVEKKVSTLLNINARAVISPYPEIGNDVDKTSDLLAVTAHLKGRALPQE